MPGPGSEEWQCRIQGGQFFNFFEDGAEGVARTREFVSRFSRLSAEPMSVLQLDTPGFLAATEILAGDDTSILAVRDKWFEQWEERHPDMEYYWHVSFISYFEPWPAYVGDPDDEEVLGYDEPSRYDEILGEEDPATLWVHHAGTYVGPLAGQMLSHLWKWDGEELRLLKEGFDFTVS